MKRKNPIQKRVRTETVKRVASNFLGMEHFSWIALVFAAVLFLGAGWVPDGITNLLLPEGSRAQGLWQMGGALLILASLGLAISHQIEKTEKIAVSVQVPPAAKILVVFLSPIGRRENEKTLLETAARTGPVNMDDAAGTSWEMPLLAIDHHIRRLERLVVVTSQARGGSHVQFEHFRAIARAIFREGGFEVEELTAANLDFEDVAAVHGLLDQWYEETTQEKTIKPHDIIVDLTGGQKPASIAAAIVTLTEGRRFQYVSTTDKTVQSYDLIVAG